MKLVKKTKTSYKKQFEAFKSGATQFLKQINIEILMSRKPQYWTKYHRKFPVPLDQRILILKLEKHKLSRDKIKASIMNEPWSLPGRNWTENTQ